MSTAPKKPCAPPLNLVANGAAGSPFPSPLDETQLPTVDDNPGFGDLVTQLLGEAGDSADGFDQVVADTLAIFDQADQALAAGDADLDAILALLAAADTSSADTALADYESTFTTGAGLVKDAAALAPPDVLEFPLNATRGLEGVVVPILQTVDLGSVVLGSAPIKAWTGTGETFPDRVPAGVDWPQLVAPVQGNWQVAETDRENDQGIIRYTYTLVFTPDTVGSFTQQMNVVDQSNNSVTIYTFTVTVV